MALSDSVREQDKARKTRSITAETNKRWSDKQKLEAVKTYLVSGNLALTSRMLGIPEITLRVWKTTNWWTEVVNDLKVQDKIELSGKLKRIMEAAHQVVENRLVNGDAVLIPKTGEIVMKPVSMKDAHRVAVDMLNQREMVEKLQVGTATTEDNTDKLQMLAEKFATFATMKIEQTLDKTRTIDVEDVTIVDTIPKES